MAETSDTSGTDERPAKERIQAAAVQLFASKGFAGSGMREIASAAGVSLAMINYHFGSKEALLEAILTDFFTRMRGLAERNIVGDDAPEAKLRRHLRSVVAVFRDNPAMARVAIAELPHDIPGIVHRKAEQVSQLIGLVTTQVLPFLPEEVRARLRLEVVGPLLIGGIALHFMMRPVIEDAFGLEFDGAFYEGFADELVDLLLYGIFGDRELPELKRGDEG